MEGALSWYYTVTGTMTIDATPKLQYSPPPETGCRSHVYSVESVSVRIDYTYRCTRTRVQVAYDGGWHLEEIPDGEVEETSSVLLGSSDFDLSFNSEDYPNYFVLNPLSYTQIDEVYFGEAYSPGGLYQWQIHLKYDKCQVFTTPKGSTFRLGGGVELPGTGGQFAIFYNDMGDMGTDGWAIPPGGTTTFQPPLDYPEEVIVYGANYTSASPAAPPPEWLLKSAGLPAPQKTGGGAVTSPRQRR
jgi:hypothetical protein